MKTGTNRALGQDDDRLFYALIGQRIECNEQRYRLPNRGQQACISNRPIFGG